MGGASGLKIGRSLLGSLLFFSSSLWGQSWKEYKQEALAEVAFLGEEKKGSYLMEVLKTFQPGLSVELGVSRGASFFPMAKALSYTHKGQCIGIDVWAEEDYAAMHALLERHKLEAQATLWREEGLISAQYFNKGEIDFLHFDALGGGIAALALVEAYLPNVKEGGFILLSHPNVREMQEVLVYLLERAELLSPFAPEASFFLFRKTAAREEEAAHLCS